MISYTCNGYTGSILGSTRTSSQRLGDEVKLLVDPADPSRAQDGTLQILAWVFGGVGAVFLIAGTVCLCFGLAASRREAVLYTYGKRVTVTITDVRENLYVRINRRHPVQLFAACSHPLTGVQTELHSQNLLSTALRPGDTVDVLFDPQDERHYLFDIPNLRRSSIR